MQRCQNFVIKLDLGIFWAKRGGAISIGRDLGLKEQFYFRNDHRGAKRK